mgnify:CR=1 FL=1
MRTFIIITILLFISNLESKAIYTGRVQDIFSRLQSLYVYKHISYGYGDDDNSNYNNDDDNSNYNNDDDNSNYNNDDDNYSSGDDDDSNDDDDSSEIPLDGGLSFLALAGAGLGIKKLRDNSAKKKTERNEQ